MTAQASAGGRTGPDPLRVLVVDDSHEAADNCVRLLAGWGHQARAAYDGLAALQVAQEFLPGVALLDLGLPGMDGYQLALRLRRLPGLQDLVLIAITGYDWKGAALRSQEYGFNHHRVKPVDPDDLQRLLGELNGRPAGAEDGGAPV